MSLSLQDRSPGLLCAQLDQFCANQRQWPRSVAHCDTSSHPDARDAVSTKVSTRAQSHIIEVRKLLLSRDYFETLRVPPPCTPCKCAGEASHPRRELNILHHDPRLGHLRTDAKYGSRPPPSAHSAVR